MNIYIYIYIICHHLTQFCVGAHRRHTQSTLNTQLSRNTFIARICFVRYMCTCVLYRYIYVSFIDTLCDVFISRVPNRLEGGGTYGGEAYSLRLSANRTRINLHSVCECNFF